MEKVRVIILEDGITAKELNPFGDKKPSADVTYTKGNTVIFGTEKELIHKAQVSNWEKKEKALRTFNIYADKFEPNSKHDAIVLASGKIEITS